MLLMMKVVERVAVARSFAKIAAGLLTVTAVQASQRLRAVADVTSAPSPERPKTGFDRFRKIARAAAEAAVHVATHRPVQPGSEPGQEEAENDSAPVTEEAPATR